MEKLNIFQIIIMIFSGKITIVPKKIKSRKRLSKYDRQKIIGFFTFFENIFLIRTPIGYMNKKAVRLLTITIVASFFLINTSYPLLAYVRKSTNYKIQTDSINSEGGDDMISGNYIYRDTLGEVSSGASASATYKLKAGYRQMNEVYLTVSSPSDIVLSPAIPGITGGLASGDATWTIITDNPAGFNMKVKASGEVGMMQDNDWYMYAYTPAAAGSADYGWSAPLAGSAEYGFSVTADTTADADTPFLNTGAVCGSGANNTDKQCWYNFTTSDLQVIYRSVRTDASGEAEKINFQAQSNGQFLREGYYDSYIIITVVAN